MTEATVAHTGPVFLRWVAPVIDAVRAMGGEGRAVDVIDRLRADPRFTAEDRERITAGGSSSFANKAGWARLYLTKGGFLASPKRGIWRLTEKGASFDPTPTGVATLFDTVRETQGWTSPEEDAAAPEEEGTANPPVYRSDVPKMPEDAAYWFAGASWDDVDQTERFLAEGVWENGYDDQFSDLVRDMRPGEKIAIKASFVQKKGLPFDIAGGSASGMRIKATGTILENPGDGKRVLVAWDPPTQPRMWYFYTYRKTLIRADLTHEMARALVDFTFSSVPQDYGNFLADPYWAKKYGRGSAPIVARVVAGAASVDEAEDVVEEVAPSEPPYTVASIVADGCFVPEADLADMLRILEAKKNLVLQGPPGTGKTWLAKRLAAALVGRSPKAARDRMRIVQFHPSLSYEDFVRGWRPSGDGKLTLTDGVFLEAVAAAKAESDVPFVVVVEEINRGNPAQIFGELLTLLEHDKRREEEALALAYRPASDPLERVFLPENLYLVGTMNIADRSLALVDLALRRRFAFITLTPRFGDAWARHLAEENGLTDAFIADLARRMSVLNDQIATKLGTQFQVGHSYLTPRKGAISDGICWFEGVVSTEIGPLHEEYFYDAPSEATRLVAELVEDLA